MTDETNETQNFEYQQPETPTEADVQIKQAEQSRVVTTADEMNSAKERKAFETYVKNQGLEVPKNFKDASSWFDSLKNAQKEYTKARQEISQLKKTYEATGIPENNIQEDVVETTETQEPVVTEISNDELRITQIKQPDIPVQETKQPVISEEDWSKWSMEVAMSGSMSQETIQEIKGKTGFSDKMISEYVEGQKARSREAFSKAADLIGSKEKLNSVFAWAAKTMTPQQQAEINATLASPSWEVALLGLEAKYNKATGNSAKGKEMPGSKKPVNVPTAAVALQPYKTKREFYADRSNSRYNSDPKFRQAVERRLSMSDISRLPN